MWTLLMIIMLPHGAIVDQSKVHSFNSYETCAATAVIINRKYEHFNIISAIQGQATVEFSCS